MRPSGTTSAFWDNSSQITKMRTDQALLRTLLSTPGHPDLVLIADDKPMMISAHQAVQLLNRAHYQFRRKRRRVCKIQRMAPAWSKCWRTTAAATLQPSIEWMRGLRQIA